MASQPQWLQGNDLIQVLAQMTGLPTDLMERDIIRILAEQGYSPETVTMEQIQECLFVLLESLNQEISPETGPAH